MSTPDFTKAQVVAVVGAVVACAVAFGTPLDQVQRGAILGLAAILAPVLVWADVKIRQHRAENADKIAPKVPEPTTPPSA